MGPLKVRPERSVVEGYYEQLRDAMATLVQAGLVHGDLSPYNTLAAGDRLVIIDLPQMVDLVGNPRGMDFLLRDCANMCAWFRSRGLEVDEQELFGELMAHAFDVARSGRPGPVLVDITKDVFQGNAHYHPVNSIHLPGYKLVEQAERREALHARADANFVCKLLTKVVSFAFSAEIPAAAVCCCCCSNCIEG